MRMDSILPPAPAAAAPAYPLPPHQVQPQPQLPPGSQPRGRPPADPEVAEQRAQRHQERKRVEGVMPKKALDSKILIYRTKRGRPVPGAKPVCTVLISELEAATADGAQDPEDYLRQRLAEKIGDRDQAGAFQCVTVDRRGARITEVPAFDLSLVESDDEDEEEEEPEDVDGYDDRNPDPGDDADYDFRGRHPVLPPAGPPPPPTQIDLAAIDDVGRRNREEEKSKANESMTMMLGLFQTMQAQAQAQAQAQQQMLLAFMGQNQAKAAESQGTTVALITALAPVLKELLAPKPDTTTRDLMLPLLMELIKEKRVDPSSDMLKTIPGILSEVSKQQISLQSLGAEAAVKTSAQVNSMLMQQMMSMARDVAASAKPQEKDDSGMGGIAQIAAAVLPALMGKQQPQQEPGFTEQPPALPAPAAEAPAPAPRRRPKTPAPAAAAEAPPAAAEAAPAPAPPPVAPEDSRIRGCLQTIRKIEDGTIPAAKYWDAVDWIAKRIPARVMAAVNAQSTEKVMRECAEAVLPDTQLLTWVSDSDHVDFLTSVLDDLRVAVAGQLTDDRRRQRSADIAAHQAKTKAAPAEAKAAAAGPVAEPVKAEAEAEAAAAEPTKVVDAEVVPDTNPEPPRAAKRGPPPVAEGVQP